MSETIYPSDVNINDKRRFRIVPLKKSNIDLAGVGEIVVDRETGDIYVINEAGEAVSRTDRIESNILQEIFSNFNSLSYMYNKNRRVYRLFFADTRVRIDSNLTLSDDSTKYRVRSYEDDTYLVSTLTNVGDTAEVDTDAAFIENKMYYVEFYNKIGELISMIPFLAKKAYYMDNTGLIDDTIKGIKIYTNKKKMYLGEPISNLLIRVMAEYNEPELNHDITNSNNLTITTDLNVDEEGTYTITADWIYDTSDPASSFVTDSEEVTVVDSFQSTIVDVIVLARVTSESQQIILTAFAIYEGGEMVDVTEIVHITGFNSFLYDVPQTFDLYILNSDDERIFEKQYTIKMNSNKKLDNQPELVYNDGLLTLQSVPSISDNAIKYRVRAILVKDPNSEDEVISSSFKYYTPDYTMIGEDAIYSNDDDGTSGTTQLLPSQVLVEFYNEYNFVENSIIYNASYITSGN